MLLLSSSSLQRYGLAALSCILYASAVTAQLQFCHVDEAVDVCFAATAVRNEKSHGDDLYLTISSRFVERQGWVGVGVGDKMAGALMFVIYPGEKKDDVTVSVRTAYGYQAPHLATKSSDGTPDIKKLSTSVVNDTFTATMLCYSCNTWPHSNFSATNTSQGFVWATHWTQDIQSNDIGHSIRFHPRFGVLHMNMTQARGSSDLPEVSSMRVSSEGVVVKALKHHHEHKHSHTAWRIHGILLSGAFMLVFPLGTIAIRAGFANGFLYHWTLQVTASCMFLGGVGIGIYKVLSGVGFAGLLRTHQLIGLTILFTIPLQMFLGYLHHQYFVKHSRRTGVSYAHMYLGRVVMFAGMANVGVGLNKADAGSEYCAVWISTLLLEVAAWGYWWYMTREGKKEKRKYKKIDDTEHGE